MTSHVNAMQTLLKFLEPYEKKWVKKLEKEGPTITVSGMAGTGTTTIAQLIAKEMNIHYCYPHPLHRERSKKESISLNESFAQSTNEENYEIEIATLEASMKGNVVIDSRLAGYCAGGFANFKIFVECDEDKRAERMAQRDSISKEAALNDIRERDELVIKKLKQLYNVDITDTSIYDMVLDNSCSMEELEQKVKEIVNRINVFG
jgi:cytidylate kinase